jgi:hypothetical protein
VRIIITGSRDADLEEVMAILERWWFIRARARGGYRFSRELVIVEGGCPTGADLAARKWAQQHRLTLETHRADWDQYGSRAGPIRNRNMVELGADLLMGFPLRDGESKGTWGRDDEVLIGGCVREAVKCGIKAEIWGVARQQPNKPVDKESKRNNRYSTGIRKSGAQDGYQIGDKRAVSRV